MPQRRQFNLLLFLLIVLISSSAQAAGPFRQAFGQVQQKGRATISNPPGGPLVVSNIGSSGLDGVVIDVGGTRGAIGPVRWMAPESLRGRGMTIILTGEDEYGTAVSTAWSSAWEGSDLTWQSARFDPLNSGQTQMTITVRGAGNPLYEGMHGVGSNPMYESSNPPTGGGSGGFGSPYDEFGLQDFTFEYPPGTTIRIPGVAGTFQADQVSVARGSWPTEMVSMNLMQVLGTEPQGSDGEMMIVDMPSGMFGHVVGSFGAAEVIGVGTSGLDGSDRLRVSNIGSSGQDGVCIVLDDQSTAQALALEFAQPPVAGNKLFVGGLSWNTDDGTGTPPPVVNCEYNVDSFFDVWTELSVNDPPSRVEYLLGGEVVGVAPNPATGAQLHTSVQYPYQLEYAPTADGGINVEVRFASPVTFIDTGGLDNDCDGVRLIHPPDPIRPFYPVNEICLRAADLPGGEMFVSGCPNTLPGGPVDSWTQTTALNNANVVAPGDGTVRYHNLGSSGQDGWRMSFAPAPDWGFEQTTRSKRPPPTRGHVTVLKLFGGDGDKAAGSALLGEVRAEGNDTDVELEYSASMAALGPDPLTYNFYDDGVLVGTAVRAHSEVCFTSDGDPQSFRVSLGYPDGLPRMIFNLPPDAQVALVGSGPVSKSPAMNKAELIEVIYTGRIVTPFTDITDAEWRGSGQGAVVLTAVGSTGASAVPLPGSLVGMQLHPAAPDPFNPRTVVAFELARVTEINLQVFDLRGHLVRDLMQGNRAAGQFQAVWNGMDNSGRAVASGTYVFRLQGAGAEMTRKAVLVR